MQGINLNDSNTTHKKNLDNASFETIFTNCKNDQGQMHEKRIKKILVFNKDHFFPR